MTQLINDHYTTTLSDAMLAGERRVITTHHGFKIKVPIQTKHLGEIQAIKQRLGVSLTRQLESLVNRGISVRVPIGGLIYRIYGQQIREPMVWALNRLRRFHNDYGHDIFVHLRSFQGPRHGEWARLRWWGLIEPRPLGEGEKVKDIRGWWRLTGLGHAWLRGDEKVPRVALMFDGAWVGWRDASDKVGPTDVASEFDVHQITNFKPRGAA